jgi:hypothetical protein
MLKNCLNFIENFNRPKQLIVIYSLYLQPHPVFAEKIRMIIFAAKKK